MSDPASEAAQKCWTGFSGGMFTQTDPEYLGLLAAAREALKPIRAELDHARDIASRGAAIERDFYDLVEALSSHVYTDEELDRG